MWNVTMWTAKAIRCTFKWSRTSNQKSREILLVCLCITIDSTYCHQKSWVDIIIKRNNFRVELETVKKNINLNQATKDLTFFVFKTSWGVWNKWRYFVSNGVHWDSLILIFYGLNSIFSTKYTGIFTFFTVGFLTGRDLWKLIGNHSLPLVCLVILFMKPLLEAGVFAYDVWWLWRRDNVKSEYLAQKHTN